MPITPHNLRPQLALEVRFWIRIQNLTSRASWGRRLWGVIGMFYPRQNSVLTLYFALGIMGVVGTADIGAFQFRIQPTAKSATAPLHFEANHQNGEWKTLKKIIGG